MKRLLICIVLFLCLAFAAVAQSGWMDLYLDLGLHYPGEEADSLLLESTGSLLLEDGSALLLESA